MTYSPAQTTETRVPTQGPTLDEIKARMKATWEDGDYARFATYMEPGAIEILLSWRLPPGQRLLDIGCGAGQTAIPAARLGHRVVGIDIAENLIDHANARASAEGVDARFDVGDAEDLPYADHSFDVVISLIGAMFAPRPDQVVQEIARVLRPGGRLYMANWTPQSMPAQMFKCVAAVTPPPPGFISPALWGDEVSATQRLSDHFGELRLARKTYPYWSYPFDAHGIVDVFRTHFGPVKRAFDKLADDPDAHAQLHQQLHDIYRRNSDVRPDGTTTITGGEYLEIVATRHGDA
jgi:SAM-dependent methyltransferase